ncbi:hypothetical protein D3C72_1454790 [compost metagenome]
MAMRSSPRIDSRRRDSQITRPAPAAAISSPKGTNSHACCRNVAASAVRGAVAIASHSPLRALAYRVLRSRPSPGSRSSCCNRVGSMSSCWVSSRPSGLARASRTSGSTMTSTKRRGSTSTSYDPYMMDSIGRRPAASGRTSTVMPTPSLVTWSGVGWSTSRRNGPHDVQRSLPPSK